MTHTIHDELYNALLDRLNTLMPSRLELREGCEVRIDDIEDVCTIVGKEMAAKNTPCYFVIGKETNYVFKYFSFTEILGTPPTLQEIVSVLPKQGLNIIASANFLYFSYGGQSCRDSLKGNGFEYDLTKPVKDQETSTLQAIYELLV